MPVTFIDIAIRSSAQPSHSIIASFFKSSQTIPNFCIVINSATGSPRRFYRSFARFLADIISNCMVITWDYRGVGDSIIDEHSFRDQEKPEDVRRHNYLKRNAHIDIVSWALDQQDVIQYAIDYQQVKRLVIIGHSVGAQIIPLLPVHHLNLLERVLFIGGNSAYYPNLTSPKTSFFFFRVWMPLGIRLFGYGPCRRVGLCDDIPAGVGRQWAKWSMLKRFMIDDPDKPEFEQIYALFNKPVTSIAFSDDEIANNPSAFTSLLDILGSTEKTFIWLEPKDIGCKSIGHNGFFKCHKSTLPETQQFMVKCVEWISNGRPIGIKSKL